MEQVLIGDIFSNIEPYLCIKDLYELSWSCKKINNTIDVRIKKKIINKINIRLRSHLGKNYAKDGCSGGRIIYCTMFTQ
uniref:F-box domain-containing protein n=1 Tax=viral metagenome TaxID=1070528 RepID=A0A6C0C9S9_9ZZZZ